MRFISMLLAFSGSLAGSVIALLNMAFGGTGTAVTWILSIPLALLAAIIVAGAPLTAAVLLLVAAAAAALASFEFGTGAMAVAVTFFLAGIFAWLGRPRFHPRPSLSMERRSRRRARTAMAAVRNVEAADSRRMLARLDDLLDLADDARTKHINGPRLG